MSRTTSRVSPLPDITGKLSSANGPVGTDETCRKTSFTYSSTVEGAADSPANTGSGWRIKPGVSAKLLPNWMPPKYALRPHMPARVVVSPTRRVRFSSGKSLVNVVSSRSNWRGCPKVSLAIKFRPAWLLVSTPHAPDIPSSVNSPKSLIDPALRNADAA